MKSTRNFICFCAGIGLRFRYLFGRYFGYARHLDIWLLWRKTPELDIAYS